MARDDGVLVALLVAKTWVKTAQLRTWGKTAAPCWCHIAESPSTFPGNKQEREADSLSLIRRRKKAIPSSSQFHAIEAGHTSQDRATRHPTTAGQVCRSTASLYTPGLFLSRQDTTSHQDAQAGEEGSTGVRVAM